MSLTVKVFFERLNGSKEIRRFPVDSNSAGSFSKIKEKIKQLYPTLAHGNFNLYWQDPDGDRVAFSTDEELKDAVSYVNDGVLRVYIPEPKDQASSTGKPGPKPAASAEPKKDSDKPQQQQQQTQHQQQQQDQRERSNQQAPPPRPEPAAQSQVHVGVTCDGCEGAVVGIRFKCCVCPDYDLCQSCEAKGMHTEHDMYKITVPRPSPLNFLPPHMGRYLNRCMRNMMHTQGSGASNTASASFSGSSGAAGASASAGANATGGEGSAGGDASSARAKEKEQYDNYLRNVGANIAAFLDPFGIDVSYDVRHNDGTSSSGHWTGQGGSGFGMGMGARCGGSAQWGNDVRKAGQGSQQANQEGKTNEGHQKMDTEQKQGGEETAPAGQSTEPAAPMETETDGAPRSDAAPTAADASKPDNASNGNSDDGWLLIDETSEPQAPPPSGAIPMPAPPVSAAGPTPPPRVSTGPNSSFVANASSCTNLYPNLRVQQSLEQMLTMGFTNNDGWLTELLTENNGDIGVVLDVIKARATQQLESLRK